MLRFRDNIKWTLCGYHKNRRYVSGKQRALAAFIEVKEPHVEEWVDVSRPGGYVKMRMQPQFVTVRSALFWGQRNGKGPFQVDDERVSLRIWRVVSDIPSKGLLTGRQRKKLGP
jgi:hypothetical protein